MFEEMNKASQTTTRPPLPTNNPHPLPIPPQLLHQNTTTANQVLGLPGRLSTFNPRQLRRLRIVAITASALSLVFGSIGIFCLLTIDRRRKVFRHDLLFFLIVCGFIKALVLMLYPMIILIRDSVLFNIYFFNILGWLTAYTVEGSDMAIFFFAVHFALLIFKPSRKWRNKRTGNLEGGLYRVRAIIWPLTGSVPLLLASLAFIDFTRIDEKRLVQETNVVYYNQRFKSDHYARIGGYKPFSAWCYLPPYPVWYKIVLSWGPRYFLIIFILTLYAAIYGFVVEKSKKIKRDLGEFRESGNVDEDSKSAKNKGFAFLFFFIKPIVNLGKTIKNFVVSTDYVNDQERAVLESETGQHGLSLSFFHVVNEDDGRNDNGQNDQGRRSISANPVSNHSNGDSGNNTDNDCGNNEAPVTPKRMRYSNQAVADTAIQDDDESGLYRTSSNPRAIHNESNVPCVRENARPSRPNNLKKGLSFHNIFRPFTGKPNNDLGKPGISERKKKKVNDVQADFQRHTYAEIKKRRLQIQKNVKLIFIYPFSYIAIWIFPLVVDATQYQYEIIHGPIVWLAYISTIVQPLNCFVDTLVFLLRERPWRSSWCEIEASELMDSCMLKGELTENDIVNLCTSDLGKRGWYFRGRLEKKHCWRHQPEKWKRAVWYIYRFFKGMAKNKYDFSDNCLDQEYWDEYYFTNTKPRHRTTQKQQLLLQKERQFSFPSDSTTLSETALNQNNVPRKNFSSMEESQGRVPLFWKAIHFIPMLKAIDLDELNRQIRLKSNSDAFVIPGLQVALGANNNNNNNNDNDNDTTNNRDATDSNEGENLIREAGSLSSARNGECTNNSHTDTFSGGIVRETRDTIRKTPSSDGSIEFSDGIAERTDRSAFEEASLTRDEHDNSLDMLAFLKEVPS